MKLNDILGELKHLEEIGLNKDSFVIVYGAALVMQGVRKETHDLDLQCIDDNKFDEFAKSGYSVNRLEYNGVLQIHLTELSDLHKGKLNTDTRWEDRFGYNVQTVQSVLEEKMSRRREKDKADIELIEKFLLLGDLVAKPWEDVVPLNEIVERPNKEYLQKLCSKMLIPPISAEVYMKDLPVSIFDYMSRIDKYRDDKIKLSEVCEELKEYASRYPVEQKLDHDEPEHDELDTKKNTMGCGESYISSDKDRSSIYPNWQRCFSTGNEIKVTMIKKRDPDSKSDALGTEEKEEENK